MKKAPSSSQPEQLRLDLRQRMARPQRHRLLQGYPMAPLLRQLDEGSLGLDHVDDDEARPLIVGVLPHTSCNPKVRGCGFCTFPHERFENSQVRRTVEAVVTEVRRTTRRSPELARRPVDALYFGGGTANLTPPEAFQSLAQALEGTFQLRNSEVSLEGVPRYFLLHDGALMDTLARMKVRHRRISMGVQTFDPVWLARMGRDAFGTEEEIRQVVEVAHARGFTASADLLFNLPGRTLAQSLEDVRLAIAYGFDQICVYNLVLTEELGTEWASDARLVQGVPDAATACRNWLEIRRELLDSGFVQTTLTNFERKDVAETPRRFVYEPAGFNPGGWDALGFGPAAISTFRGRWPSQAYKWMNAPTASEYVRALEKGEDQLPAKTGFQYEGGDLSLLHLTRSLARLSIDIAAVEEHAPYPLQEQFGERFAVLEEAGLLQRPDSNILALTPEGMFFADAIAGLLAAERVAQLRARPEDEKLQLRSHMG